MNRVEITLSAKGLQNVARINRKDFQFVSGSDSFVCDRFQAAFLSPYVANLLSNDPTIDQFSLTHAELRSFSLIEELIVCNPIVIDEDNFVVIDELIEDLGNSELSAIIWSFIENRESLNLKNCVFRINRKYGLKVDISQELEFIGSHICEMNRNSIQDIEMCILKDILKMKSLRIENEDWLLEFIFELGDKYLELIGFVRFEYLSLSSIDLFFERINFEDLNSDIWHQLWNRSRRRLIYDQNDLLIDRLKDFEKCSVDCESPFSGLICRMSEICGGNVHEKGFIDITCSSCEYHECWQIVDYDWTSYFHTKSLSNSWIQFDLKDRMIFVTDYALKSDGDSHHLLQWTLSGSLDGNTWTIVDNRNT
jgi:hypothetical protein